MRSSKERANVGTPQVVNTCSASAACIRSVAPPFVIGFVLVCSPVIGRTQITQASPVSSASTVPSTQTPPAQAPTVDQSVAPAQSSPQSEAQGEAGQFVFRKQVEEVILHAVVVDRQNNLISNLSQGGFQVFEDGKQQQITSFHQEHVPVALGILIDNSGSMRPKRDAVNQAAINLIRTSNPQDEIFVVNFGENFYLDQDFTNDVGKLQTALGNIETRGSTALYDAVVASAAHMKQQSAVQKRALLVVTDGEDNASQETLEEAVKQLQQKDGPVVYVIALPSTMRHENSAVRSLQILSQSTGGTAYFPSDMQEVDSITRSIASAIRSQYVIGYKSSNTAAGRSYHGIDVEAYDTSHRRLQVRTRTGYYSDSLGGSS
jgi:Ca-activated chloride channel family protein